MTTTSYSMSQAKAELDVRYVAGDVDAAQYHGAVAAIHRVMGSGCRCLSCHAAEATDLINPTCWGCGQRLLDTELVVMLLCGDEDGRLGMVPDDGEVLCLRCCGDDGDIKVVA